MKIEGGVIFSNSNWIFRILKGSGDQSLNSKNFVGLCTIPAYPVGSTFIRTTDTGNRETGEING